MEVSISELALPLVHPFTIARSSDDVARTALFQITWNELEGWGESSPSKRYGDDFASMRRTFETMPITIDDPYLLLGALGGWPPAARCGLDVALHDLIGKDLDRPLWRLLGVDPEKTPLTSFTIGIDTLEVMLNKVEEVKQHPVLKIKLGQGLEIETVEAIRERYTGAIRIDANEAWTPERAVTILREIEKFGIEFCEQPIPAGTPERLRYVREHTSIPIVADEDARTASDLPGLAGCVSGINIKLVKCGGIRAALEMIHTARALGLRIMLGCMVESSILTTAAAHLSPLVDWADLDGPFLTAQDPFLGVTYTDGKLTLPPGPGLGVRRKGIPSAV